MGRTRFFRFASTLFLLRKLWTRNIVPKDMSNCTFANYKTHVLNQTGKALMTFYWLQYGKPNMTKVVWVLNHLLSFSNRCMRLGNHCTRIWNHNSRMKRHYTRMRNHHSKKSDAATWKPNMTKVVWVPTNLPSICNRCVRILITVRDYRLGFSRASE